MGKISKIRLTVACVLLFAVVFSSTGFSTGLNKYDQYLINALKDNNYGIRASAAQLLGERKVEAAVKPLIKMLKTETLYACRIVAAKALYDIGDKQALTALRKVAKFDRNKTERHVAAAIVKDMEAETFAEK